MSILSPSQRWEYHPLHAEWDGDRNNILDFTSIAGEARHFRGCQFKVGWTEHHRRNVSLSHCQTRLRGKVCDHIRHVGKCTCTHRTQHPSCADMYTYSTVHKIHKHTNAHIQMGYPKIEQSAPTFERKKTKKILNWIEEISASFLQIRSLSKYFPRILTCFRAVQRFWNPKVQRKVTFGWRYCRWKCPDIGPEETSSNPISRDNFIFPKWKENCAWS